MSEHDGMHGEHIHHQAHDAHLNHLHTTPSPDHHTPFSAEISIHDQDRHNSHSKCNFNGCY